MAAEAPRILSPSEARGCESWRTPNVDAQGGGAPRALTAAQLESLQRQAWDEATAAGYAEGMERGYAEGREQALEEVARLRERLTGLLDALAAPIAELDETLERELVTLAATIARQLVRREIRTDPTVVAAAVREASAALPAGARRVRVRVHPGDLEQVRAALAVETAEGWAIAEDASIEAGGCRIESEYSRVDADVESRIASIIEQVLGGEPATGSGQ